MKKILYLITLLFQMMSFDAMAAGEWIHNVEIKTIEVQPNGNIYLWSDKVIPNRGCTGNGHWLEFDRNAPNFQEHFSLVMAAYLAKKKVRIYVNGCGYFAYAQNTLFEF